MEKIAILLRKTATPNRFRKIILDCFSNPVFDEYLICSGFFQERGKYSASSCFLKHAPQMVCSKNVTLVGVYNAIWAADFERFANSLKGVLCGGKMPLSVEKRKLSRYRWHAKVFVASKNGVPIVGIVGSSNLTVRAFGEVAGRKDWNYEADVVLWDDSDSDANNIVRGALGGDGGYQDGFDVLVTDYASAEPLNRGLSMQQKLSSLQEEILKESQLIA